ncbi:7-methylguanosine phosphate-specific 5'-nucleotidase [Trichonephila clavata]|uniref:5'-nucleotidase n=1 Tax=Trichonephila clavata TaxID=2740835 RepID=A0A8X6FPR0_TRICU|nr:7-methylguanosine phosphate-specific 5'-nucleotidase [Trichonephila clavata]
MTSYLMEILNKNTVHIKNRDHVEEIVSQLIRGSASKLQVISDFDQTLSRVHMNGEKCTTTYGIFEHSSKISQEYKTQTTTLYNHYHPIEVDPHLTKAEKVPHMIEWYTKCVDMMPSSGITKDSVPDMVADLSLHLRDGCEVLFESLYKHNVPLLIFSAGIGDVLKEVLCRDNLLYPNVKIIANFMQFDEENKLTGFKNDLIHTFNKNQSSIENHEYFNHVKARNNVILLGDSLGDLDMAAGVQDADVVLKIGFLNFKVEENLDKYLDTFDIVLSDDQTMDVVIGLLQNIL